MPDIFVCGSDADFGNWTGLLADLSNEPWAADTDAGYWYNFATYCFKNGHNAKAYAAAQEAVDLSDIYDGKAYWLMGNIWAAVSCGGDDVARRSKYWVATDFMNKAKAADRR